MDDREYKIVISGLAGGEQETDNTVENVVDKKTPKGANAKALVGAALVLATVRTAVNYSLSSIEMYTGNSVAQRNVQEILSAPGAILGFVANPAATLVNIARAQNATKWETRRAEQMARRSGNYLSTTTR